MSRFIDQESPIFTSIFAVSAVIYIGWTLKHSLNRTLSLDDSEKIEAFETRKGQMPIKALVNFYDDGSADLKKSAELMLSTLFFINQSTRHFFCLQLASYDLETRWKAINLMYGQLKDGVDDCTKSFYCKDIIRSIIYGLLESLEKHVLLSPKAILHRRMCYKMLTYMLMYSSEDTDKLVHILMGNGFPTYKKRYEVLSSSHDKLTSIDAMLDRTDKTHYDRNFNILMNAYDACQSADIREIRACDIEADPL